MKKLIFVFIILLIGCGSRTSKLNKESEKLNTQSSGTQKSEGTQKTESSSQTESETSSKTKLVDLGFGFSITPLNGQNSFFNFVSGKDTISLQTNAKVDFNKNNKTEEKQVQTKYLTITNYITETTYKTQTTYRTETTYKTEKKNKETDRKAMPWWLFIILGMVLYFVLSQIINKNTFVSLWNRLIKKQ